MCTSLALRRSLNIKPLGRGREKLRATRSAFLYTARSSCQVSASFDVEALHVPLDQCGDGGGSERGKSLDECSTDGLELEGHCSAALTRTRSADGMSWML